MEVSHGGLADGANGEALAWTIEMYFLPICGLEQTLIKITIVEIRERKSAAK